MCWHYNGSGIRQYDRDADDSERLVTHEDLGLAPDAGYGYRLALGSDGTVWTDTYAWVRDPEDPDPAPVFTGLASYDGERWTTVEADRPVPGDVAALAVAPDGTVWVVLVADANGPSSTNTVMTWDGKTWDTYGPVDDGGSELWYSDIGFAPDGTVWVVLVLGDDGGLTVVKWDGKTWDTFGPLDDRSDAGRGIHFAPDGRVWFGATTFYDGRDLRQLEIPATIGEGELRVGPHAFGPDGSLWVVLSDMRDPKSLGCEVDPRVCQGVAALYVITPEALAATE
jgi:WD40 repeat protein